MVCNKTGPVPDNTVTERLFDGLWTQVVFYFEMLDGILRKNVVDNRFGFEFDVMPPNLLNGRIVIPKKIPPIYSSYIS